MNLSNLSRKGLEEALQKALSLLPPQLIEEVVASLPKALPPIDHTKKKASDALGLKDEDFDKVAAEAKAFAKSCVGEGGLRSEFVEQILGMWTEWNEREKALFVVLVVEVIQRMLINGFSGFMEIMTSLKRLKEAKDELH